MRMGKPCAGRQADTAFLLNRKVWRRRNEVAWNVRAEKRVSGEMEGEEKCVSGEMEGRGNEQAEKKFRSRNPDERSDF